jgi:hypothetical protein
MKLGLAVAALFSLNACRPTTAESESKTANASGDKYPSSVNGTRDDQSADSDSGRLTGEEILVTIAGKRLSWAPLDLLQYEQFETTGIWGSMRGGASVRMQKGHWFIHANQICVQPDHYESECRSIWKAGEPNYLHIFNLSSWNQLHRKYNVLIVTPDIHFEE